MIELYENENNRVWIRIYARSLLKDKYYIPYGPEDGAALDEELYDWMEFNHIEYTIGYYRSDYPNKWFIRFENNEDAMIFKLIWA